MPRDSMLARIVVITSVAVAATVIGLSVASSNENETTPAKDHHQQVASAPAATAPTTTTIVTPTPPTVATTIPPTVAAKAAATAAAPAPTAPASTVPATTAPPPTAPPTPVAGGAVAIGDSVLEDVALYAPTTLSVRGVNINAAVSRQWAAGETIVATMRASGSLPAVVVMALGSNGPITSADFDQMMGGLTGVRRVVFMTVTGPLIANNDVIRAGVARYPQAVLADWATLSASHPTWFAKDHVHVGAAGAAALGQLFASVV